nr:HNH endonuclease signature motif containing protein [Armatimonas rosea]
MQVITRAESVCEYCGAPMRIGSDLFCIEHTIPEADGGATSLENLALACSACNLYKGAARFAPDPVTNQDAPLFDPRRQSWPTHFIWSADTLRIIGITPTGRATTERLRMNRDQMVEFRRLLREFGLHPPAHFL